MLAHRVVSRELGVVTTEGEGTVVTFDYVNGVKVPLPRAFAETTREQMIGRILTDRFQHPIPDEALSLLRQEH